MKGETTIVDSFFTNDAISSFDLNLVEFFLNLEIWKGSKFFFLDLQGYLRKNIVPRCSLRFSLVTIGLIKVNSTEVFNK